jgi:hypothetical protein
VRLTPGHRRGDIVRAVHCHVTVTGVGPRAQRLLDEFAVATAGLVAVDAEVFGAIHERHYRLEAATDTAAEKVVHEALDKHGARPREFTVIVEPSAA